MKVVPCGRHVTDYQHHMNQQGSDIALGNLITQQTLQLTLMISCPLPLEITARIKPSRLMGLWCAWHN